MGDFKLLLKFDNTYKTKVEIDNLSSSIICCYQDQIVSTSKPPCIIGTDMGIGVTVITFGNKNSWVMQIVYNEKTGVFSLRQRNYTVSAGHFWAGWKQ